ncbi:MAG: histidine phosphatase family protein [Candidatus Eisenbacteria bacterium]
MDLFLVRHAIAFEPDPERWPDDRDRPLTREGRDAFRRAARGLDRIVPRPTLVLSSPFQRAMQTARLLERHAGWPPAEKEDGLSMEPNWPLLRERLAGLERVALVGHAPYLGQLASLLLAGDESSLALEFKKGTVARIEWDGDGRATLRGLWSPRMLRTLVR